jgi:hypothetical protein
MKSGSENMSYLTIVLLAVLSYMVCAALLAAALEYIESRRHRKSDDLIGTAKGRLNDGGSPQVR